MTENQFNDLVIKYQKPVISSIYKMVHSWEIARDLAQESFFNLWKMKNKIIKNKPVFTLLYRIAMNLSIDYLRNSNKLLFETFDTDLQAENNYSGDSEFKEILFACCTKLNPRQRAVFTLRDLEGFSFKEIGEILKITVGNARSNLYLARQNIKQTLFEIYQIDREYFNEM